MWSLESELVVDNVVEFDTVVDITVEERSAAATRGGIISLAENPPSRQGSIADYCVGV